MSNDTTKQCTCCKNEYPATNEYFSPDKSVSSGLQSQCKRCLAEKQRARYLNDLEYRNRDRGKKRSHKHVLTAEQRERKIRHERERRATDLEYRKHTRQQTSDWFKTELGKKKSKEYSHRKRAKRKGAAGYHTTKDIELQYSSQKGKCWHCGKPLNGKYHVDHLIPLSKGGTDWANNIVCSCEYCNLSKGAKMPHEWNGKLF